MAAAQVMQEYDRAAAAYDEQWEDYTEQTLSRTAARVARVLAHAKKESEGSTKLVDIGCGTGSFLIRLLQAFPHVEAVGVDVSRGMLDVFKRKLEALPDIRERVRLVHGSAENLSALLLANAFDVVVCTNCFHFFANPAIALQNIFRVLRAGGRVVVADWCDDFWACTLCKYWLRFRNYSFQAFYTQLELIQLLLSSGFHVADAESYKISALWGLMTITAQKCDNCDIKSRG
jgi:ubiquinone/menaquinone biosynthesis C-methylase UbiE